MHHFCLFFRKTLFLPCNVKFWCIPPSRKDVKYTTLKVKGKVVSKTPRTHCDCSTTSAHMYQQNMITSIAYVISLKFLLKQKQNCQWQILKFSFNSLIGGKYLASILLMYLFFGGHLITFCYVRCEFESRTLVLHTCKSPTCRSKVLHFFTILTNCSLGLKTTFQVLCKLW